MKIEPMIQQLRRELELIDTTIEPLMALVIERGAARRGRPPKEISEMRQNGLSARSLGQRRRRLRERVQRRMTA